MSNDRENLLVRSVDDGVVHLVIDRPPANALDSGLIARLLSTIRGLAESAAPPALVLAGEGERFFSAGGDIREFVGAGADLALSRMRVFHALLCAMETYPAAIVSAVRGYAVGGGLELLLYSDYVVAGPDAQAGFPEINHGLLPAAMGMRRAADRLGRKAAQSLLYSGSFVGAGCGRDLGIFDEVVASDEVEARAFAVAGEMRGKDPNLFAAIKRSLNLTRSMTNDELESMTLTDMRAYLDRQESAEARTRFLRRNTTSVRGRHG